jgi:hypothetical protein
MKLPDYLKEAAKKCRDEFNQVKNSARNINQITEDEIIPGQIWKVVYGDGEFPEATFAVTVSKVFQDSARLSKAIRIAPIFCSPLKQNICSETDLVVPSETAATKITSLLEWWNDRPVKLSQLDTCYGTIENDFWKPFLRLHKDRPEPTNKSRSLMLFREEEIARGSLVSSAYVEELFDLLAETVSDTDARTSLVGSVIDRIAGWFMDSILIPAPVAAFRCSEPGFSESFAWCRKEIVDAIVAKKEPEVFDACVTDDGFEIFIGKDVNASALALIGQNGEVVKKLKFCEAKLKIEEGSFDDWKKVRGFRFLPSD